MKKIIILSALSILGFQKIWSMEHHSDPYYDHNDRGGSDSSSYYHPSCSTCPCEEARRRNAELAKEQAKAAAQELANAQMERRMVFFGNPIFHGKKHTKRCVPRTSIVDIAKTYRECKSDGNDASDEVLIKYLLDQTGHRGSWEELEPLSQKIFIFIIKNY